MRNLNFYLKDNIAFIEFNQPGSKVNVLNNDTIEELAGIIDKVSNDAASDVKALVITSKKDDIFIAGADIKELEEISSREQARDMAEKGKKVLDALENLKLITVAVINGACLGGGFELALACKYRVAGFSDRVRIGLPEARLGLIPGWGGTQRLSGLVGLKQSLDMILFSKIVGGKEALRNGLVDRLFSEKTLIDDTCDFVKGLLSQRIHVRRTLKNGFFQILIEKIPLGRAIIFWKANKDILRKTKGFYPAPIKALDVIKTRYDKDIHEGFLKETKAFSELAVTDVSKNLIRLFYLKKEFNRYPWVDDRIEPVTVNKAGVLGAGVMGRGIAQLLSFNDIPTRLNDVSQDALKNALKTEDSIFEYALNKKRLKKREVARKLKLISPTVNYKGFEDLDIVIETVVEDLDVKQRVFKKVGEVSSFNTIFASNTSSLPIIRLAEVIDNPERVCGLHFFNPVHRMPLVEVIRSGRTKDEILATVIGFVRRLGKVPIVVKDSPGFLINRIVLPYLNEAGFLIEDGVRIERIDRICRQFGMPMGPVELIDEIGIDVCYKVTKILEAAYATRMQCSDVLETVKKRGMLGKKIGFGFYFHKGKNKTPNPRIYDLVRPCISRDISDEIALKRMLYIMINEAAMCLKDEIVDRPEVIDIGMVMGTGFPAFRAGLLRYADSIGIDNIVRELRQFKEEYNLPRFTPCEYLLAKAENNQGFYIP